jgi:hypothetical protein
MTTTTPRERAEAAVMELDRRAIGEHWIDGPRVGNYVNRCLHGFGNRRNCNACLTDALLAHTNAEVEREAKQLEVLFQRGLSRIGDHWEWAFDELIDAFKRRSPDDTQRTRQTPG